MGAAIQGGVLRGDVKDILLLDVTPLSLVRGYTECRQCTASPPAACGRQLVCGGGTK